MNTLNESLNKGIPNDIELSIPFADIINLSSNKNRTYQILAETLAKYYTKLYQTTGRSLKFFYTNKHVQVGTNQEDLGKYLTISPVFIQEMIEMSLNPKNICSKIESGEFPISLEITEKDIEERLAVLKKIKNLKQLQREFPSLYKTYNDAKEVKTQLDKLKKLSVFAYMEFIKNNHIDKADLEMMETLSSVPEFITYTHDTLAIIISRIDELSSLATIEKINSRIFGASSAERLELYIADTFAEIANHPTTNLTKKQKCCYYLSAYMFENYDKLDDGRTVERLINNACETAKTATITKRSVYDKFKQLLINNPELFNVNFDNHMFKEMTIEEIDTVMSSYMQSLKLKWDIIPDGHEIVLDINEKNSTKGNTSSSFSRKKQNLTELFYKKKAFFDSSEPFLRVMGKDTFNGYIGYIYPNGTVILDKFYEDSKTKKLAKDVAIYCMGIDDFYRLSQLSKTEIIRDRLCKRFYHSGDWQTKVKKEITGQTASDMEQKTHILRQLNETQK